MTTIIPDSRQAQRPAWRFPDGRGIAVADTGAGLAITAKTVEGTWMPLLRLAGSRSIWIGPYAVTRHAAQRWLETALRGGGCPGGTEHPYETESGTGRGAKAPEVHEDSVLSMPTPLGRLYAAAMATDVEVVDDDLEWLAEAGQDPAMVAAVVAFGDKIVLGPGLDDDGDRADVLAMGLSVSCQMAPRRRDAHPIIAPSGFVLINRDRVPAGPIGRVANAIAARCGRDTGTASFGFEVLQVTG